MKKFFNMILAVSVVLSSVSLPAIANNVELSAGNEIHISSVQDLTKMASDIQADAQGGAGKVYVLDNDISLENKSWSANIGVKDKPFCGTFDGQGHVIKDYSLAMSDELSYGLFGVVSGDAVIKNVGIENVSATASTWTNAIGGLAGELNGNATVEACYAKSVKIDATTTYGYAKRGGGLIGLVDGSGVNVKNCYSVDCGMDDSMVDEDGGVIGGVHSVNEILNCYADTLLTRCKDESLKDKVINSYYTESPHWPSENYAGTRISKSQLRAKASDLGEAYTDDSADVNGGYPILLWQKDSRTEAGDAVIVSSSLQDASDVDLIGTEAEIYFDKFLDKSTITAENIIVNPTAQFTVTPGSGTRTDYFTIAFDGLDIDTEYTITFADGLKTAAGSSVMTGERISFHTVKTMPEFKVMKTVPEDNATDIQTNDVVVTATFNDKIDFSALTNAAVLVEPSAEFDIAKGNADNEIKLSFKEELKANTSYTILFRNSILSVSGSALVEKTIQFKTAKGFSNLVENGNMESTNKLSVFDDKNNNGNIMFADESELKGTKNNVMKFSPAWSDQPVITKTVIQKSGTYRMSAWIKSEEAQEVALSVWCGGDNWDTRKTTVEANKWQYISEEFVIAENLPEEISVRSVSGKVMYIDDWSIYEVSLTPDRAPILASSDIADGETEVSTLAPELNLKFDSPVRFDTLISGITMTPSNKIEKVLFDTDDTTRCTIMFGNLDPSTQYTLNLSGVKNFRGASLGGNKTLSFTTVKVNDTAAKVVSTVPGDGQTGVSSKDTRIEIVFDSPMNPDTISQITVSPDAGAKVALDSKDIKKCIITLDNSKVKKEQKYTVSVPESVTTINGQKAEPYTFSFTTNTIAELVEQVNAALGDKDKMKAAIETVYPEMEAIETYDYIKNNLSGKLDEFYEELAGGKKVANLDELTEAMNGCAFKIILNNVSDEEVIEKMICSILNYGTASIFSDTDLVSASLRADIVKSTMANKSKTYAEIYEDIVNSVICKPFKTLRGADGIEKLLKLAKESFTGNDSITELLDKIDAKADPAAYYKKLQGINPETLSDIKKAITNVLSTNNSGTGGNTGGSSGGTGGGSYSGGGTASSDKSNVLFYGNKEPGQDVFGDLDSVLWARDSIVKLYNKGIVNGKGNNMFAPNDTLTRAEFAKIAVLTLGGTVSGAEVDFSDLDSGDWSYPYVASAYKKGLINGIGNGMFGGNQSISREDMAVILARMANNAGIDINIAESTFSDANEISDYARKAVAALNGAGIINGVGDGKFDPKGITTRAQAAVVFDRFLNLLDSTETGGEK